jgi:putative glutamine amidotransferase
MSKSLVAVTGPDKRLTFGWWATRFMLWLSGLKGIYLTPRTTIPDCTIEGIIIGGGDDIEPVHYGDQSPEEKGFNRERDQFEIAMIRRALDEGIPILGICRGAQLINVVHKGTLYQDIRPLREKTSNRWFIFPLKWARLLRGKIRKKLDKEAIKVNSLHNQAIKNVGEDLEVTARDEDDFVQAVEGSEQFVLGVQWHPEYLPYRKKQRDIFKWFASEVEKSKNTMSFPQRGN